MAKRKAVKIKVKDVPVQVARWMDQARHDLENARKTFRIHVYDVAIISCEQSLEKALKALYIAQKQVFAPRTHEIAFFAEETQMRPLLDATLLKLQDLYFLLRYPEPDGPMPFALATREDAQMIIKLTAAALPMIQMECDDVQQKNSETAEPSKSE